MWDEFAAEGSRRLIEHRRMSTARRMMVSRLRTATGKRYEDALARSADISAAAFDDPLAGVDSGACQAVEKELDAIAREEIELNAQAQGAEEDDTAVEQAEFERMRSKASQLRQLNEQFSQAQAGLDERRAAALAAWNAIE